MRRGALFLLLLIGVAGPAAARHKPPPLPLLTLDLADPVIEARVGSVTLRLRVDLDAKDVVTLNPAAAARLPIAFTPAPSTDVGRITLRTKRAAAVLKIAGREVPVVIFTQDADCCSDADGVISPVILPYAQISLTRPAPAAAATVRELSVTNYEDFGLYTTQPIAGSKTSLIVQFAPQQPLTLAQSAAGAMLAEIYGGQFTGPLRSEPVAFGVKRPVRAVALAQPVRIAGFSFSTILTRIADYGRGHAVPMKAPPDAINVRARTRRQVAWPQIALGNDVLGGCFRFDFFPATGALRLTCAAS